MTLVQRHAQLYTRAQGERPLGMRLKQLLPALWLGLAPCLACTAHAPERAPCGTVYDFRDEADPRCAASRPDGIYPIGYATPEVDGPSPSRPRSEIYTSRTETTARTIKAEIARSFRGDVGTKDPVLAILWRLTHR